MYTILDYGWMLEDRRRIDAFAAALAKVVTPGSTVADIGSGTGIFALIAARHGARKVYAIDDHRALQVAIETADENGLADRIVCIQQRSTDVELPERVDVIVSELHGILPMAHGSLAALIDARERMLKPGGVMIPARDTVRVALASSAASYRVHAMPWEEAPFGFRMADARRRAMNTWQRADVSDLQMLSEPETWLTIDYATLANPNGDGELRLIATQNGIAHGFVAWMDLALADDITLSNAPELPRSIYRQGFFPFEQPVEVEAGDVATIRLRAVLTGDAYAWSWQTRVERDGRTVARFTQATPFAEFTPPPREAR